MKVRSFLQKCSYSVSALALTATTMFPSLMGATAHAFPVGGQVTSRSIKMSSSQQSATGVSYQVTFNTATAHTIRGIIVDFCAGTGGSPIVGDTNCAAPTGFTVGTPTVTYQAGITAGYTATNLNTGRTLKLTKAAGDVLTAGASVQFTLTTATNTSTLGTFYARIITYSSDTGDIATYTPANPGSADATDYGGIALSTASQLTITAKVQESLVFCVYVTGTNCGDAAANPAVPLGDANGVLASYSTNYTNTAKFGVSSNAQGGVVVNLKGNNLCRVASPCTGTTASPNTITPTGAGAGCTLDSPATGNEQFGLRLSALGTGVTAHANYACAAGNHSFREATTTSTYGDQIASTAGPGDQVQSTVEFMAKAATTTEAGIYTTSLGLIATGTY